tara:strand:- start:110 stop:436 length:327 start_codon:yes stop_codon:yes gene_type:complete
MKKFINQSLVIIFFLTSACGGTLDSVKRGLSGQKSKNSTDEFLVKKKDPLILPPGYNDLPKPGQTEIKKITDETNISDLLKIEDENQNTVSSETTSLEESILKNINNN